MRIEAKLDELGLVLPGPMRLAPNVTLPFPWVRVTSLVWSVSAVNNISMQFKLRKRSFGDNGAVTGDAISDSLTTTSAGPQARESVRSSPYLIEQNMMYELSIQFAIGNFTFDGARLMLDGL